MGAGVWYDGKNFDNIEMCNFWVEAANYTSFNSGNGPSPWVGTEEAIGYANRRGERNEAGDERLLADATSLKKDVAAYEGEWSF